MGRLRRRTKAGYGLAELGVSAAELMLQVYLLELYIVAGLDPFLAGLALAIAVVWDAVSDPLMGVISDRTRARSLAGKRLPYYFGGTVLLCISVWSLFSPNADAAQSSLFAYLLFWYLLVNTAMTLVAVPHLAMANDLGHERQERTELFGWRLGFGALGLLFALLVPLWVAGGNAAGVEEIRAESGFVVALLLLVVCLVSGFAVWRPLARSKASAEQESREGLFKMFKLAMKSRGLRLLIWAFVFISIGRAFNSSLALIFYKGTLAFTEEQVGLVLIVLAVSIIAAAPAYVKLAERRSKRKLSLWAVGALTVLTAFSYPFLPERAVGPVLLIAILGGAAVASVALLEAMFSDEVDKVERREGEKASGACFGIWRMSMKAARAGGLLCSGWFLAAVGYEEGIAEQSEFVERSVAWAFGPGVAVFFGIGWFVLSRKNRL
ncbi:MAG: MFS transporter [Verrucomicrobiota bacterium]